MEIRLRILLTNDDGFSAPGIRHIYTVLKKSHTITVVAPEEEQSGVGHAFTYHKPLTFRERIFQDDIKGYSVSGTPADCVKFALGHILAEKPDVVVSGINNGNNTGIAGYYSGTVAAAREGAFWQIPGIAFSLSEKGVNFFKEYASIAGTILQKMKFDDGMQDLNRRIYYNVNFPSCRPRDCAGIKITRQSLSFWDDRYTAVTKEDGVVEYWLHGERKDVEIDSGYDARAVEKRFVSVTPLQIDATALDRLESSSDLEKIL